MLRGLHIFEDIMYTVGLYLCVSSLLVCVPVCVTVCESMSRFVNFLNGNNVLHTSQIGFLTNSRTTDLFTLHTLIDNEKKCLFH